jgi:hypothetical protein
MAGIKGRQVEGGGNVFRMDMLHQALARGYMQHQQSIGLLS